MAKLIVELEIDIDDASYEELKGIEVDSDADVDPTDPSTNFVMVIPGTRKTITGARVLSSKAEKVNRDS